RCGSLLGTLASARVCLAVSGVWLPSGQTTEPKGVAAPSADRENVALNCTSPSRPSGFQSNEQLSCNAFSCRFVNSAFLSPDRSVPASLSPSPLRSNVNCDSSLTSDLPPLAAPCPPLSAATHVPRTSTSADGRTR